MRALYPGSFDPLTLGHLDLIERSARLFDGVIVAVLQNPSKCPAFSLDQRLQQIRQATAHLVGPQWATIEVGSFDGLSVEYARQCGAEVILRGLRAMSDFEFELQIAHTNKSLAPQVETLSRYSSPPQLFEQLGGQGGCSFWWRRASHGPGRSGRGPLQAF